METLLTSVQDGLLTITLNRPEKRNALTSEMTYRFDRALIDAADDDAVQVVLVRSNGAAFSAGFDLRDFIAFSQTEHSRLQDLPIAHLFLRIVGFEKPLVAAVQGLAFGIGTTLLLHCDAVVAARNARFSLPFSRLALVPEFGSTYLLPLMAGRSRARYHMLLGEPFDAVEAHAMGIVHDLCAPEDVQARAFEVCRRLCALPPHTLVAIKHLTQPADQRARLMEVIEAELKIFEEALRSPEHGEAVAAFFEKRVPDFGKVR